MKINCHSHVFNFKSVLTSRTLKTLLNRLTNEKWPAFVVNAVEKALSQVIKGKYLDEEQLLREFVKSLSVDAELKKYLTKFNTGIPVNLQVLVEGNVSGLAVGALRDLLGKLSDQLVQNEDAANQTLNDLIAFLAIGIRPTIDEVARNIMGQVPEDAGIVALMMDIVDPDDPKEGLFIQQLEDTAATALAFPGRIFPFVAVNTLRPKYFERMELALGQRGFLGVKLYPSLGYPVASDDKMNRVFDYCLSNEVPLLMHCNRGGFKFDEASTDFCHPRHWRDILQRYPGLKICFAHFGGGEFMAAPQIDSDGWAGEILKLMDEFPGVYADISYHTEPMSGGAAQDNYFNNLRKILQNPVRRDRVLFGTDYHLVRLRLREDNHWRFWESRLSAPQFKRIAETNPAQFLGLPTASASPARNIQRYLDYLYLHQFEYQNEPAQWALNALRASYGSSFNYLVNLFGHKWSPNNEAHYWVWQFWRGQMWPQHRDLPFLECGGLRMRQMMYWNKEHESPEIFQRKCKEQAENMNKVFRNKNKGAGARYETGINTKSAQRKVTDALSNGDTRLCDLGPLVDSLYLFRTEQK